MFHNIINYLFSLKIDSSKSTISQKMKSQKSENCFLRIINTLRKYWESWKNMFVKKNQFLTFPKKVMSFEKRKKNWSWNWFQNRSKKNVENLEIRPDSETLTSNTWELVDSNFNQFPRGRRPRKGCRGRSPLRKWRYRGEEGESPHNSKKCDEFFFTQILMKISQTSFQKFQTFYELFKKKMQLFFSWF